MSSHKAPSEGRVDFVVWDDDAGPVLIAEAKAKHIEPRAMGRWQQLVADQARWRAPYALLFTPSMAIVLGPDGEEREFDSGQIMRAYGVQELSALGAGEVTEMVLRAWLVDLTFGTAREAAPDGFPDIRGDEVRVAA
jgi:hypothetical protein